MKDKDNVKDVWKMASGIGHGCYCRECVKKLQEGAVKDE